MKTILVINYSQTGQLDQIVDNFLKPFKNVDIDRIKISPKDAYPFPWTSDSFFDLMPETVLQERIELNPIEYKQDKYDLVILGYQPWFLSPSLPTSSLLEDPAFKAVIKDTPVVTIIGARNMWINSQENIKKYLFDAGAQLVANIPLIDKNPNLLSVVSILHWMLNGKKEKKYGVFPKPGVSDEDIESSHVFGEVVSQRLESGNFSGLQDEILSLSKIDIAPNILFIELRAKKIFNVWAKTIKKKGVNPAKRKTWLRAFKYYLLTALFLVSPIVLLIFNIIIRPLTYKGLKEKKNYFCSINYR